MKQLLPRTLPGRAIVIGLSVKLAVFLFGLATGDVPAFLAVMNTVATIAAVAGGAYFLFRGLAFAKRRLLWRVRRKLIISYIFIGFIPAILISVFFLLGGLLLFYTCSSYLVQSRLRTVEDRTQFLAESTALEIQRAGGRDAGGILGRRAAGAREEFPGVSLALVRVERPCARTGTGAVEAKPDPAPPAALAGPWEHLDPPPGVPSWIGCEGFGGLLAYRHATGLSAAETPERQVTITFDQLEGGRADGLEDTHMFVRAVAFPDSPLPGYAVVVDVPVDAEAKRRLRAETGVELNDVSVVPGDVRPAAGRPGGHSSAAEAVASGLPLSSLSFLEWRDWDSGRTGTLALSMRLSISEIYQRISSAQGLIGSWSYGQLLLLVLLGAVGSLFLIIEIAALVAGLALAKSITGSVHELFTGTERVRQGDFTHKIAVKAHDQLGELAESFNSMTASIEDLLRQAAAKKRMEEELRIAREIQMSLLPQGPLSMPGLSVCALCVPAREVGGDYYDFFPLDDRRLGVLIADVSGKGTSAALYMAELKGLMLSLSRIHASPRELMIVANGIIAANLDARSFITMIYAVVDLRARTMTYARAGHTPLMHLPAAGGPSLTRLRVLAPDGLVLGLKIDGGEMFERLLREETIPLHAGDLYLFFTDGISEAMNAGGDCFGEQRLGRLIEEHGHLPSEELRERLLREIAAFVGDAPQHDDMTMILLKIDEAGASTPITAEDAEVVEVRS